jgi:hypothetical protein
LEELINDIESSTARYEASPLIITKTKESDIFTRRHHSNNRWRKTRVRKHKHNKSPKPSNGPTNIHIFTKKQISKNETNINGQVKEQIMFESVITESLKDAKLFEDRSRFPI